MISNITIDVEPRTQLGKGAARQLRSQGKLPITLYGGEKTNAVSLVIDHRELRGVFKGDAGRNTIFQIKLENDAIPVIIKDWQVDPLKGSLLHADLFRIDMAKPTRVVVSIIIEGEAAGVKVQGGLLDFATHQVEVECLPKDIPDRLRVDVSDLNIGDHLSVKDLHLGDNVRALDDPDRVIVSVLTPRVEQVVTPSVEEAAPSEPEVIKKGKEEEEEE